MNGEPKMNHKTIPYRQLLWIAPQIPILVCIYFISWHLTNSPHIPSNPLISRKSVCSQQNTAAGGNGGVSRADLTSVKCPMCSPMNLLWILIKSSHKAPGTRGCYISGQERMVELVSNDDDTVAVGQVGRMSTHVTMLLVGTHIILAQKHTFN